MEALQIRLARTNRVAGTAESAARTAMPLTPSPGDRPDLKQPDFKRELAPAAFVVHTGPSARAPSSILRDRLGDEDVALVERRIGEDPESSRQYTSAEDEQIKRHVLLAFGMWLREASFKKTGLTDAQPPEVVHVMARGALAAAGGLYEADLVVDALASAGVEMGEIQTVLDFGCSSGRVVRVLAAAYPELHWQGCDPNGPAITWATQNLPGIEFFTSGNEPPLARADSSLDLAYAISIWSHFEPRLGLRWFEEMHRLVRPGGYLVWTTHGPTSVAHYAQNGLRTPEQSTAILDALYREGWWYAPEFGEEGDWGVVNPDWGTAFLSPEWVLAQLCPRWRVLEFAPGRNQGNQDIYVFQRV
jgi:SAM-dependent methyltransferase